MRLSDLTSSTFIASFRRFVSRRGHCAELLSDNATTFRGADGELRSLFKAAYSFYREVSATLAMDGTQWSLIPPYSPHFGGLWEAAVKSAKYHLRRVIGEHTLTYEEMATLLCQVEACRSSRPLTPMSDDPSDLPTLTPGHFLVGEPLISIPEPNCANMSVHGLTRWKLISNLRDHFWLRWTKEYLHQLQQLPSGGGIVSIGRWGTLFSLRTPFYHPPNGHSLAFWRFIRGKMASLEWSQSAHPTRRPHVLSARCALYPSGRARTCQRRTLTLETLLQSPKHRDFCGGPAAMAGGTPFSWAGYRTHRSMDNRCLAPSIPWRPTPPELSTERHPTPFERAVSGRFLRVKVICFVVVPSDETGGMFAIAENGFIFLYCIVVFIPFIFLYIFSILHVSL